MICTKSITTKLPFGNSSTGSEFIRDTDTYTSKVKSNADNIPCSRFNPRKVKVIYIQYFMQL